MAKIESSPDEVFQCKEIPGCIGSTWRSFCAGHPEHAEKHPIRGAQLEWVVGSKRAIARLRELKGKVVKGI